MILQQGRELESYIDTLIDPNSTNYNAHHEVIYISEISLESANNIGELVKKVIATAPGCVDQFACDLANNRSAIKLSLPLETKKNKMIFKQYDIVVAENAECKTQDNITLNVCHRTVEHTLH